MLFFIKIHFLPFEMHNSASFMTLDDFELGKYLGSGQFGQVWLAKHKKSGYVVALKLLEKEKIKSPFCARQLRREIEVHSKLKHANILRLHGYFHDKLRIYLVLEYAAGGELFEILQKARRFNEQTAAKYILQVCKAIKYLQVNGVIHRDIKPENILLGSDDCIKIADFGAAVKNVDKKRYTMCGTKEYLAPEMWEKQNHSIYLDMWCIGILTYEFLTGNTPFGSDLTDNECKSRVNDLKYTFPAYLSFEAKDFIGKLLKKEPEKRLKIDEVPQHSWIVKNVDESERISFS
ncbi:AUR protein kinase [Edhazardia aedis USNM 41457]|uniref:Aurora kinase n=1 Tax=Edhazardia aedis (strain USNM 41457) TaxID=1003232 RepID=J9DCC4_EDHAE|nr:AUR protein kinase [Edhazardia aedis USNM 41457]|eukprot:EJW05134.1 AUR protein kinase [Edhazardia aedis USNM 41457]